MKLNDPVGTVTFSPFLAKLTVTFSFEGAYTSPAPRYVTLMITSVSFTASGAISEYLVRYIGSSVIILEVI